MQGTNVTVRASAAEALGLLYAQCGLQQLPHDDDELLDESDEVASSVAVASAAGSLDCSSCGVSEDARTALQMGFDGIITQIEALSKNRCVCLQGILQSGKVGSGQTPLPSLHWKTIQSRITPTPTGVCLSALRSRGGGAI